MSYSIWDDYFKLKKMETIDINIWDDYYEDGYVPDDEIQETYAYVESGLETLEEKKDVLNFFMKEIMLEAKGDPDFEMKMEFYDSKLAYPNIPEEYNSMHYERWEIRFKGLTHSMKNLIVLHFQHLKYNDVKLRIYSES